MERLGDGAESLRLWAPGGMRSDSGAKGRDRARAVEVNRHLGVDVKRGSQGRFFLPMESNTMRVFNSAMGFPLAENSHRMG